MTKVGGLGDVSAALPAALRAGGVDVRVLIPGYEGVLSAISARTVAGMETLGHECRLLESDEFLVLDCPMLYVRDGNPYQSAEGLDWEDNAVRFGVLSRVAALLGGARSPLTWRPHVVHCHDWPAGLAPAYLAHEPERAATLMTIHNLAFQGNFDASLRAPLDLPPEAWSVEGAEFYGSLSFLKGGLAYADALSTVSPTYAREIQTPDFGSGLDGLLRRRREVLTGILNGIDTAIWDPAHDARIAQRYDERNLDAKALNKAALQARMGLAADDDIPLIGLVGRFTHQKGIDLVAAAGDELAAMPAQLALLGKGERTLETALAGLAARHPGRIALHVGFSEDLAHLIEAGADVFLMPSRFEPCGLNQMYSQRYGTPPVANATGGLVDTVSDEGMGSMSSTTGYLMKSATADQLLSACQRAIADWRTPDRWRAIQRNGMARDFGWATAAREYAKIYAEITR